MHLNHTLTQWTIRTPACAQNKSLRAPADAQTLENKDRNFL